jgi:hypothetical protein
MSEGKAIARARTDDKTGYNEWSNKGRPDIFTKEEK